MASTDESKSAAASASRGRIAGKAAIVTGGANGIGKAIVQRFVDEGASHIAVFDVADDAGAALVEELAKSKGSGGTAVRYFHTDMSSEDNVAASVKAVTEWTGGALDILVNNAAAFVFGEVETVTADAWDKVCGRWWLSTSPTLNAPAHTRAPRSRVQVLGVNVKGYAFAMKHTFPVFSATGGGSVVNIASISAFIAQPAFVPCESRAQGWHSCAPNLTDWAACGNRQHEQGRHPGTPPPLPRAKHPYRTPCAATCGSPCVHLRRVVLQQMTRCTALDGGKKGIRVNWCAVWRVALRSHACAHGVCAHSRSCMCSVCPGPILTDATAKHAASEGKTVDQLVDEMSGQLILKRMGSPKEVAHAVLFLVSVPCSF